MSIANPQLLVISPTGSLYPVEASVAIAEMYEACRFEDDLELLTGIKEIPGLAQILAIWGILDITAEYCTFGFER